MSGFAQLIKELLVEANSAARKLEKEGHKYAFKLYYEQVHVGYIRHDVMPVLQQQPATQEILILNGNHAELTQNLNSKLLSEILYGWHKSNCLEPLKALRNWRQELYGVQSVDFTHDRHMKPPLTIERAAAPLFGIRSFGCHLNGYVRTADGDIMMWIARRSKTKQNYPGMLDNLVGGGLPINLSPLENMVKESHEEAGIPFDLINNNAKMEGSISFLQDAKRGVVCETDYIFDLELPLTFRPTAVDGEVEEFFLMTFDDIEKRLVGREFTPESGLVIVDFMLRHKIHALEPQVVADLQKHLRTGL